ncbi:MAG TPA: FAD-dependent oxidoreductase [Anaerolineae bacterium]|nr:FAD-dependent oxidoreductase [Anaerolineae bacterium]HIQ05061.1 FAD-dependent oxidoreductase [Anaerolineae bacterium]
MTEHVDVAVIGAGPAGLHAALAAAQVGAQVVLVDAYQQPGGQYFKLLPAEFKEEGLSRHQREGKALWRQVAAAGVRLFSETTVWGLFEGNVLALYGPEAPGDLQAQAVILATGAYDRPVAFPGWTLPGVITTGAAQTLLKYQRVLPGKRVVLAGTGPLQLVVAAELVRAGAEVVAILEGASLFRNGWRHVGAMWGQWERLREGISSWWTLLQHRVPYRTGWGIVEAHGDEQVSQVTVARLDDRWHPIPGTEKVLACDTLCLGYGFVTSAELTRLLGAEHEWRPELGGLVPRRDGRMQTSVPGVYAVGDGAGVGGAALAMVEGQIAGLAAAAQLGYLTETEAAQAIQRLVPALIRERRFQRMYAALFTPGPGLYELARDDTLICRCEEITQAEIRQAVAKGADSSDEVKAITRAGMGNCQGRVCAHLMAHLIAREMGRSVAEVGLLRPRPPIYPIPMGVL